MRILFLCGREIEYPRNRIILTALRQIADVDIVAEHGTARSLSLRNLRIVARSLPRLVFKRYDLIFAGFYGYILALESRLLNRAPLLFDAFVSNYDTLVNDRHKVKPNSSAAKFLHWLDKTSCRSANCVLLDTHTHIAFFVNEFGLEKELFEHLPIGAIDTLFYPAVSSPPNSRPRILYYCTYLPLHGTTVIVESLNHLRDLDCEVVLIGNGPEYSKTRILTEKYGLVNVTFVDFVPLDILAAQIQSADICLGGHFGKSPKGDRTIPGKIYQFLAAAKPVIAADTPANRELLVHTENAYLCPPADPDSLATAIATLCEDQNLRERLAENGRVTYLEHASEQVIAKRIHEIVDKLCS